MQALNGDTGSDLEDILEHAAENAAEALANATDLRSRLDNFLATSEKHHMSELLDKDLTMLCSSFMEDETADHPRSVSGLLFFVREMAQDSGNRNLAGEAQGPGEEASLEVKISENVREPLREFFRSMGSIPTCARVREALTLCHESSTIEGTVLVEILAAHGEDFTRGFDDANEQVTERSFVDYFADKYEQYQKESMAIQSPSMRPRSSRPRTSRNRSRKTGGGRGGDNGGAKRRAGTSPSRIRVVRPPRHQLEAKAERERLTRATYTSGEEDLVEVRPKPSPAYVAFQTLHERAKAAARSLGSVTSAQVAEVLNLERPPKDVMRTIGGACLLVGVAPTWKHARGLFRHWHNFLAFASSPSRRELGYGVSVQDPYTEAMADEDDNEGTEPGSNASQQEQQQQQQQSLAETEPVEHARRLYDVSQGEDILVLEEVLDALQTAKQVYDLEHVEWLITLCQRAEERRLERIQEEAMRLVDGWARNLQTYIPADGVPVPDPLRDELIDSAVTFLEDDQVSDRSIDEKVQFLLEKGLNRTEIRIACAQVGIEAPSSLLYAEPTRKQMVDNGAAFLTMEDVKGKTLQEKLSFLQSKGLSKAEMMRACEVAKVNPMPTPEDLENLEEYHERAAREDMIKNGAIFLNHKSMAAKTMRERLEFLKSKGMTATEVAKACERAGVTLDDDLRKEFATPSSPSSAREKTEAKSQEQNHRSPGVAATQDVAAAASNDNEGDDNESAASPVREAMVQKGFTFLTHQSVQGKPAAEKLAFLRQKSLTEAEIKAACEKAGATYAAPDGEGNANNSANVKKAVAFLQHPSAQSRPLREKISYLSSKGLSKDEIEEACRQVGLVKSGITMNATSAQILSSSKDGGDGGETDAEQEGADESDAHGTNSTSSAKNPSPSRAGDDRKSDADDLESRRRIRQGERFLQHAKTQELDEEAKASFLLGKGLSLDEVETAFAVAGLPWAADKMKNVAPEDQSKARMERAERFLREQMDKVSEGETLDAAKQALFLRQQGMSETELTSVFTDLGLDFDADKLDQDMVEIGKVFVTRAGPTEEARTFLREKQNLTDSQIERAFDGRQEDRIERARRFLLSPRAVRTPLADRIRFLRESQKLDTDQIKQALALAGLEATEAEILAAGDSVDAKVMQGAAFLTSPAAASASLAERKEFLRSKGLSEAQINQAFERAGLDPSKEGPQRPELDPLVLQGRSFLKNRKTADTSPADRASFLRNKGLSEEQVRAAFELAGQPPPPLPSESPAEGGTTSAKVPVKSAGGSGAEDLLVEQAAKFLVNEQAASATIGERKAYLRSKGLSDAQIEAAFAKAGLSTGPEDDVREDMVDRGARFLKDPNTADTPIEDRVDFLKQQGLTEDEILQAAMRAKVSLVPSHLCTIPSKQLKADSVKVDPDTEPSGRALQGAMNAMVALLPTIESRAVPSARFGSRALMLLATCLCRCRPARVSAACVAFSSLSLQKGLRNAQLPSEGAADEDVQGLLEACAELAARAAQINRFAKEGLDQMQQVNLHFIKCEDVITAVLQFWRSTRSTDIGIDQGMILARAVHGHFSPAAAFQPMKDATAPAIAKVIEHMSIERHGLAPVAASFFAAGLLRGAPDYAWANDVEKSPQPGLEAAFRRLARKSAQLKDMVMSSGVGCAVVYADSQLSWSSPMLWAVAECLFNEALGGFFLAEDATSVDSRARSAQRFTEREIFKLAPQLVSLVMSKLSGSQASWATRRMHAFATHVHRLCRDDEGLTGVIARRTILALYGTGEEAAATSADGDGSSAGEGDTGSGGSPPPVDLGTHAELARLLQMGYLTVVIIGTKTAPLTDDWMLIWDAMASLNAFQVRVQDTVDLEDLLKRMLRMEGDRGAQILMDLLGTRDDEVYDDEEDNGEEENIDKNDGVKGGAALKLRELGQNRAGRQTPRIRWSTDPRAKPAKGSSKDVLDPRKQLFDWVFAGRLECLLDTGEAWLHDKVRTSASLVSLLIDVAVAHPFVHLNMRAHRWITDMLHAYADAQDSAVLAKANPLDPPPLGLAIVPTYIDASIQAHPHATTTRTLSFAIGSTLSALAAQPDERAQPLALMCLQRFMLALDDRIAGRPKYKQDGAILARILLAALKAVPLPVFPLALDQTVDIIERAPMPESITVGAGGDSASLEGGSAKLTRKELVDLMFNAIQTTDDQPRRTLLAKAYLRLVQSSSCRL
ncbi:Peroxisomal membrane protein PEX14 [Hondaea fermentalgiana]|uniref:Peroxisomal membrane protein PEX14 n=1 Tax=Hondaea fermentalgiana TaxID=2315210 RepID=A0A2R5GD10_9STRA|nr:Peroxisomal membrane protein PEX14 [Hondaea fermentalgiana]|eukprot:GBG28837.1 Peroxisomal membrane protein PEX14 [Hondaea fermentalgiana]